MKKHTHRRSAPRLPPTVSVHLSWCSVHSEGRGAASAWTALLKVDGCSGHRNSNWPPNQLRSVTLTINRPQLFLFFFFEKRWWSFFFWCKGGETHQLPHYWYCRSHPKKKEIQYFRCLKRSRKNHYMTPGPQTSYTKVRGKSLQMTGATFAATSSIYKAKSIRISGNMKSWAWDFLLAQNDEMVKTWEKTGFSQQKKNTCRIKKKTKCIL